MLQSRRQRAPTTSWKRSLGVSPRTPVMFDWFAQIAQPSDKTDDPSTPWPENRELVKLGTLTITGMAVDQEGLSRSLLFLPNNVPAGIKPVDPLVDMRSPAAPTPFAERQWISPLGK